MSATRPKARYVYTELEAATFLRCGVRTLRHWRYKGVGPQYAKTGKRVLYRHQDIVEFIDRRLTQPSSDSPAQEGRP